MSRSPTSLPICTLDRYSTQRTSSTLLTVNSSDDGFACWAASKPGRVMRLLSSRLFFDHACFTALLVPTLILCLCSSDSFRPVAATLSALLCDADLGTPVSLPLSMRLR